MNSKRTLSRAAAALTSITVGLAGALVVGATPAHAVSATQYGFQTLGFGTRVQGNDVNVQSGRSAFSYIMCTRLTGLNPSNTRSAHEDIAGLELPSSADPQIQVGAVKSISRTYRNKRGDVGTYSTDKITKVVLGKPGAQIVIEGLTTKARAWADKHDKLHSGATAHGGVKLVGSTGTPLDGVLGQASSPLSTLLNNIPLDGQHIDGLGTIYLAHTYHKVHRGFANANATVLRVRLDGADTTVTIGRTWARINRDLPAGVLQGSGYGADIPTALGGAAHVGRLANQPLPCQGTGGNVRENDLAGFDPGSTGQLALGAISGRSWGVQRQDGRARGWTKGRIAKFVLGPLEIDGIQGKALMWQTRSGKVHKSASFSIGRLLQDGKEQGAIPDPGQDVVIGDGAGHDLAKLRFGVKKRTKRSIRITAVQVELLAGIDGAPVGTIIRLGNARTAIKRY